METYSSQEEEIKGLWGQGGWGGDWAVKGKGCYSGTYGLESYTMLCSRIEGSKDRPKFL